MKYDYLIIGQGLAGSLLAYQLLKYEKRIAIIDEQKANTASKVAAGLVNPFTGRAKVKTWKADVLFPYLRQLYRTLEDQTNRKFFHEKIIFRPFASIGELNDWYGKSAEAKYEPYIKTIRESNFYSDHIYDPHGGVEVHGFQLDVREFVESMKTYLAEKCAYIEGQFKEDKLMLGPDYIEYEHLQANRVVYCNGYKIKDSAYFGWLPMAPVKGELLEIELERNFQTIYNGSCFIIPLKNGRYKVGSTYDKMDMLEEVTESGKNKICEKLRALSPMKFKIVDQQAGIRPGTVTRRPLLGRHPELANLFVFNGLGTKGVSLAPFFSDQMAKCLEEGNNPDQEVDIKKYYSLYFKFNQDK